MAGRAATIARRTFLVGAGVLGGGLLVGAGVGAALVKRRLSTLGEYKLPSSPGEVSFGAWLIIDRDGNVSVAVPHQEMGQGIHSLAVLLAAEGLRLPADRVKAIPAPEAWRFVNPVIMKAQLPLDPHSESQIQAAALWTVDKLFRISGYQATGASTSTRNIAEQIRICAAVTLDMLTRAAASRFDAAPDLLEISNGSIAMSDGRHATYAELAEDASKLSPREVALPPLGTGAYSGKGIARADVPPKTLGLARYGIDAREQGQLFAAIRHSPRLGGKLLRAKLPEGQPGIRGIVEGEDYFAVVAENFSTAVAALDKADVQWRQDVGLSISTSDVFKSYRAALNADVKFPSRWIVDSKGTTTRPSDSIELANGSSKRKVVSATYEAPYLAHTTMEPMNATALVTDTSCKVWAGHQSPTVAKLLAARAAGLKFGAVELVTPYLGGGFGRRFDLDYVAKAVEIAKHFKNTPVQTIWTREEDIRNDFYRPAAMADLHGELDEAGSLVSLVYKIATPSLADQLVKRIFPAARGGLMADKNAADGALFPIYDTPNRSVETFIVDPGVPVGTWRSVGHSLNCFFMESFVDELATAAGIQPLVYRARLLEGKTGNNSRRASTLIERLVKYDAENPPPSASPGVKIGRGFSIAACFNSFVAQAADVEIKANDIRVSKVFVVADCGFAIDPPNVTAQLRSAVNYGLSAALFGRIDLENGRVVQKNFDTYPALTLANAPRITVEIVTSNAELGGVGELGTPGIAPAVANAIFAATGKRLRTLPFDLSMAS